MSSTSPEAQRDSIAYACSVVQSISQCIYQLRRLSSRLKFIIHRASATEDHNIYLEAIALER